MRRSVFNPRALALALALALAVAALAAGCGGSDDDEGASAGTGGGATPANTQSAPATTPKPKPEPRPTGELVQVGKTNYGKALVDGKNLPLYLFTKDGKGPSECYGECATAWPPLLTKGEPRAGNATQQKLLGTVKRSDGARQVTYGGQPLYYYRNDGPGQVLCQAVEEFGGTWYIVAGSGRAITSS